MGQITNGPDNDGDFDIKFMKRSCYIKDGFVFPKIEDLASVKRLDIVCKLANLIAAAATKRLSDASKLQANLFKYEI